ncbi:MAG: YitT family protein [Acidobacteriota bacterium]
MQTHAAETRPACSIESKNSWGRVVWNILLITAGNTLFVVGLNAVLVPQGLLGGGVIGIALILHYLFSGVNTGLFYFWLNLPLILLGWFSVSRRFVLYTAYGMSSFSIITGLLNPKPVTVGEPLLAAILAGILCGAGAGITLRSQGSAGGLDILSVYLNKKLGLRMGTTAFLVNAAILAAGAYFFGLDRSLYSLLFVFTTGKVMDSVLTGFNQRKSVLIVSECHEAIARQIMTRLHRGVTYLEGEGGYSGRAKRVILSIITLTELSKMKELVFDIDPDAFMVVNDTLEVIGKRHGSHQPY